MARCLLVSEYQIEHVVVSYDSVNGYNFSESTSLSECLLVARRTKDIQRNSITKFVLLLNKPKNCMESIALSNRIKEGGEYVEAGSSSAFVFDVPIKDIEQYVDNLGRFAYLPHLDLQRTILKLLEGEIQLGNNKKRIPITRLNSLIDSIGIDRHQFHDNFRIVMGNIPGSVKVLYGGEEEKRKKIYQTNNDYAIPINNGNRIFNAKSGELIIPERIRINTTHYLSFISESPCLSNLFYILKLKDESEKKIKALCIYLNTTWGILTILSSREETEGAWIGIKMSQWRLMPILDIEQLSMTN